jgi:predicted nucleotidyltransferase
MRNHIKEILFALSDAGVRYIIGGGVAAVLHGVERVTMDVDIAVDFDTANMEKFACVIRALGIQPRVPVPVTALQDPEIVRMMLVEKQALFFSLIHPQDPIRYVDVFLKPELSYDSLLPYADSVDVEGRDLKVISAAHLLKLKRLIDPPRDKDQLDIRALQQLLEHE